MIKMIKMHTKVIKTLFEDLMMSLSASKMEHNNKINVFKFRLNSERNQSKEEKKEMKVTQSANWYVNTDNNENILYNTIQYNIVRNENMWDYIILIYFTSHRLTS